MDKDGDGQITKDELLLCYENALNSEKAEEEVNTILKKFDFNESNAIDFSEFLVANINYKKNLNEIKLRQIFNILDIDRNGFVTKEELIEFFHLSNDDMDEVKEMIAEIDLNNDGMISFDEFKEMMKGYYQPSN